jgi:radical SAM superfamily enzyme YgiQ (UPF0313 family)
MKVLLISPNTLTTPYPVYPIGLDYVAGAIPAGHEVRLADLNVIDREGLAVLLDEFPPEIIGISCRNIDNIEAGDSQSFMPAIRELTDWLRQYSQAVIVCGGSGFTIMPERILAETGADYGIIGEGERFALLLAALQAGTNPLEVPGVIGSGESRPLPPPWQGTQHRRFRPDAAHNRFYIENGGMLNLQSKRGCSFRCLYCPYPQIEGGVHRLVDPAEVARCALQLQEAGAKYVFITDSAFNSEIAHSLAVADALRTAGLTIPWGAFFAPTKLPAGYFTAMAATGCRHAEFGTEALSATMLASYRKPFRPEDVGVAHDQARAAGLHVAHYFLLGGPQETAATVTETLDGIERLEKAVYFFFIGIRIYPGTALYDLAVTEGKISQGQDMLPPVYYEPDGIDRTAITALVQERAAGRNNWVIGSGGARTAAVIRAMHRRGYSGPLWEYLMR